MIRAAVLVAVLGSSPALGHSSKGGMEYDPSCCNGGDCAELPGHAVKEIRGGWEVTIRAGENPMVKSGSVTHRVKHEDAKVSTDGAFHACLWPTRDHMRCFYAPPGGF